MIRLFILLLLTSLHTSGQNHKGSSDPNVLRLSNNIISLVSYLDNPDSCKKALSFLDSATSLDKKCYTCYQNKMMFLYSLKKFQRAFLTNDTLLTFAPNAHDLYLTGGLLLEEMNDTISATKYFTKSLEICNVVLDTLKETASNYVMVTSNKAINLIMLNNPIKATEILKKLYAVIPDDPDFGNFEKKYVKSLMNKTKAELKANLFNSQNSR